MLGVVQHECAEPLEETVFSIAVECWSKNHVHALSLKHAGAPSSLPTLESLSREAPRISPLDVSCSSSSENR